MGVVKIKLTEGRVATLRVTMSGRRRTSKITTARGGGFVLFALEGALLFVECRGGVLSG